MFIIYEVTSRNTDLITGLFVLKIYESTFPVSKFFKNICLKFQIISNFQSKNGEDYPIVYILL